MKLHKDWRRIARRHWSVRWGALSVALTFLNAFLPAAQSYLPAWVNQLWFSALVGVVAAASAGMTLLCKFIHQEGLGDGDA